MLRNYLLLLILLTVFYLHAQLPKKNLSGLIFDRLPGTVGLSSQDTWKILQDRQGFLWFSSIEGLHRYDGHNFKNYKNDFLDTTSIPAQRVWEIEEDYQWQIWVATAGGLRLFNPTDETFNRLKIRDSIYLESAHIYNFMEDSQNRMWVGTRGNGLYVFDLKKDTVFHFLHNPIDSQSLSNDIVLEVVEDQSGRYWIATMWGGINRLDSLNGSFTHFIHQPEHPSSLPSNSVMFLLEDSEGFIWIATWNGVAMLDPRTDEMSIYRNNTHQANSLANNRTWHLSEDSQGLIWIATSRGISIFDKVKQQFYNHTHNPLNPNGIVDNYIRYSFEDNAGAIWLTTANGINKVDPYINQFSFIPFRQIPDSEKENSHDGVFALLQDRKGRLWVATNGGGIYLYDQEHQSRELFLDFNNSATNSVWCLFENAQGQILAGTGGTALLFNEKRKVFTPFFQNVKTNNRPKSIRQFIETDQGDLWMVADNGAFILPKGSDTLQHLEHSLDILLSICQDEQSRIWLGGEKGLQVFDPKTKSLFLFQEQGEKVNSLSHNYVTSIAEDNRGQIWVSTNLGLNRINYQSADKDYSIKKWTTQNSVLPTNQFKDLRIDPRGNIWLLTNSSIIKFDEETGDCQVFSPLPESDIISSKLYRSSNERYIFGGYWGVYHFNPNTLQENSRPPTVVFKDFKLFNQSVPIKGTFGDTLGWDTPLAQSIRFTKSIQLEYWQNDFSVEFVALNYSQSQKNEYQYQLLGYDKKWIKPNAGYPIASYTNISPGHYAFKVRATNNSGVKNKEDTSISIIISPPWWKTWWAYSLWICFVLLLVYYIYQFQLNRRLAEAEAIRLRELNELKTNLYTNITHEFRTPLTIILGIADQVKVQVSEHVKGSLQILKRNGHQLLKLVNQMLDLSKLEAGNLELELEQGDIIAYLQFLLESFESYAQSKNIKLHFSADQESQLMDYDSERLLHVITNLLSNAIKFTPEGGQVHLRVRSRESGVRNQGKTMSLGSGIKNWGLGERRIIIQVIDTGIGIPEDKIAQIFNQFYQVDNSATRRGEGTGIGLALTKELIKLMKGTIKVESKLGQGSIFTIALPITQRYPMAEMNHEGKMVSKGSIAWVPLKTVGAVRKAKPLLLLVEDNPDLVNFLTTSLRLYYQIEVAGDGEQGIQKAMENIPDLVLTDVMMPKRDGFELCTFLKDHELTSHIPIIMLTAKADVASRLQGIRRGADVYLAKPFLMEELHSHINSLLAQRKKLQSYYQAKAGLSAAHASEQPDAIEAEQENAFLQKVNRVMEANLENYDFSVNQLAQALFLSPSSFFRKLKALTGTHPNQFIRSFRLAKAKKLLINTQLPISTIALQTGFVDPKYFSRIFKKEIGQTPTQFRASQQA